LLFVLLTSSPLFLRSALLSSLPPPPSPSSLLCSLRSALLSPQMRTKERKRLERLISYEMVRNKEKILTETLRQQIQEQTRKLVTRTWMCDRFECKRRVFFSEQRLVSCLHSSGVGTGAKRKENSGLSVSQKCLEICSSEGSCVFSNRWHHHQLSDLPSCFPLHLSAFLSGFATRLTKAQTRDSHRNSIFLSSALPLLC
jgi:hypothetical protein